MHAHALYSLYPSHPRAHSLSASLTHTRYSQSLTLSHSAPSTKHLAPSTHTHHIPHTICTHTHTYTHTTYIGIRLGLGEEFSHPFDFVLVLVDVGLNGE
jgi:hypothetical protein